MNDVDTTSVPADNDGEYITINKKDIRPLYAKHKHHFKVTREESDIEGCEVWKCVKCPSGIYVRVGSGEPKI